MRKSKLDTAAVEGYLQTEIVFTDGMKNFYEQFAVTAERFAAHPAIEVQRRDALEQFTYAQLRSMAERAASFLTAHGLAPGERAAILSDNDAHWCAAYLGVLRLGGVAVPLDTAYQPKQLAALLHDSGAKILFTAPKYLAAAQQAAATRSVPTEIILLHDSAAGLANFDDTDLPPCPATPTDPAVILYTSGTTSDPKGVVLTHGNLLAEMEAVFGALHVDERDCILGVLPLFHALAQVANLLLPFSVGARVVFLEAVNSTELLRALRERGVTAFCCVPQFFYLIHQRVTQEVAAASVARRLGFRALLGINGWLRDRAGINLGPLLFRRVHDVLGRPMRLLVTGGSRFDPTIGRDLYRLGLDLLQAYGLTESSGGATVTRPGSKYTDSVGPPLPGVDVKIARYETGSPQTAPPDTASTARQPNSEEDTCDGEVLLRGPIVMPGYFNRPDATAAALADGWLHTGDLGYLDSSGWLHITGRRKEIIVLSSGKNIYPEEIEAHYLQSPYIREICVLGLARPDEPAAERLHAVVVPDFDVLRERKVLNAREILRFEIESLSIRLPSHKRILSYDIWTEELPRTTTRKLKRFEIERRLNRGAELAWQVADEARALSPEDLAWAAEPEVARALDLVRKAARQTTAIRPDANIELELGLDSMERVELLTQLEQMFGTQVPEEVTHRIYTVRELVEACRPRAGPRELVLPAPRATSGDAWSTLLETSPENDPELARLLRPRPIFAAAVFVVLKLCYALARLLFRFHVTHRENLPQQGAFLLCPNHQSYIDPILLASALPFRILRKAFFVGASEYFATPLMRWFARKMNLVPVDPDTNLLRAMQAGAFGLRHSKVLILFPEGERSIDGEVKKFKKGAPILSLHLRAPIVPVALGGTFDVWPRGHLPRLWAWLPSGSRRVSMRFGTPLPPPDPLPANISLSQAEARYAAAAEQLRSTVLAMWNEFRRETRS